MINLCNQPDAVILIVDDDETQINLVSKILTTVGYQSIYTCSSPSQAVALYWNLAPDVMLLDQSMPETSGNDILKEIKGTSQDEYHPIVMLTAETDTKLKLEALSLGAKDFINKPFDKLELLVRINTIIESKRMHQALRTENSRLDQTITETNSILASEKEKVKQVQSKLEHRHLHDPLTGLPNKIAFMDKMHGLFDSDLENDKITALVLINVNNIKLINNSLGHVSGDSLLKQVARRLVKSTKKVCNTNHIDARNLVIGRLSGNSFVVGLSSLESKKQAVTLCRQYLHEIDQSYRLRKLNLELKFNAGIVIAPEQGRSLDVLLQRADIAAVQADEQNTQYCVFDPEYGEYTQFKISLMQDLRQALIEDTLELYFQPKLDLRDWKVHGAEALLRWNHPVHGFVPPDQFVQVAEDTGMINQLTAWVLKNGLAYQQKVKSLGLPHHLSINVTAGDILDPKFVPQLMSELAKVDYTPNSLTLELTESTMVADPEMVHEKLKQLSALGVNLSIDDFGTGYSSLAYLQKLPVQELKIDKSFVLKLASSQDDQVIVKSIIHIAHYLNLRVVAEGIEDVNSFDLLSEYHCDAIQGFWISRPVPFEQLLEFMQSFDFQTKISKAS